MSIKFAVPGLLEWQFMQSCDHSIMSVEQSTSLLKSLITKYTAVFQSRYWLLE